MPLFDQIRQAAPWAKDLSDEEIISKGSELTGMPIRDVAKELGVKVDDNRNFMGAGVSSGIDDLQGLGQSAIAAGADALGATGVRDKFNRWAKDNQVQSELNGRPDLDNIRDQTAGSALPYLGYQVAKQIPNLIGGVVAGMVTPEVAIPAGIARAAAFLPRLMGGGGMAGRLAVAGAEAGAEFGAKKAALEGGMGFAKQLVGGGAFNYATGVGSEYQSALDGGEDNAGLKALALGAPHALAETLPEAMLMGGSHGFTGNLLTRMGKTAGVQSLTGATSEGIQNELEMSLNKNLTDAQKYDQRVNSIAAGGLVEGVMGAGGGMFGGKHKSAGDTLLNGGNSASSDSDALNTAINIHSDSGLSTQDIINQAAGVVEQNKKILAQRQADMKAAMDEPSGVRVSDPATGIERELTQGELSLHQANALPAQIAQAKQQQQTEQDAANQEAMQAHRDEIVNKYGGATPLMNQDSSRQVGNTFNGQNHFFHNGGPSVTLQKAIDKLSEEEQQKSPEAQAVDYAYLAAYKNNNGSKPPLTSSRLASEIKKTVGEGYTGIHEVIDRIDVKLAELSAKKGKADQAQVGMLQNFRDNLTGDAIGQKDQANVGVGTAQATGAGKTGGGSTIQADSGAQTRNTQGAPNATPAHTGLREQIQKAEIAWSDMDASGTGFYDLPVHLQKEWVEEVSRGKANGLLQENLAHLSQKIADDTANQHKIHNIADEVLQHVIPNGKKGRSDKLTQKYRDFVAAYLHSPLDDKHMEVAAAHGIGERTSQRWASLMPTFLEDNSKAIQEAVDKVANIHGMSKEDVLGLIANSVKNASIESNGHGLIQADGQSITNTKNNEGSSDYENLRLEEAKKESNAESDAITKSDAESDGDTGNAEGEASNESSQIFIHNRKSLSVSERGNTVTTTNQKHYKLLEKLNSITDKKAAIEDDLEMGNEEKQAKLDELHAQEEALMEESKKLLELTKKQTEANNRKLRNAAAVDEETGKKLTKEKTKKVAEKKAAKVEEKVTVAKEEAPKIWDKLAAQINVPLFSTLSAKAQDEWIDHVKTGNDKVKDMLTLLNRNKVQYSFAGKKATQATSKVADLVTARLMESQGKSDNAIWKETGWYKGADGHWRFEINDSSAKLTTKDGKVVLESIGPKEDKQSVTLGEILNFPEIFAAYPNLANTTVTRKGAFLDIWGMQQGSYDDVNNTINITPYAGDPLSTLLHEVQHWIQNEEGFAPGGNDTSIRLDNKEALTKLKDQVGTALEDNAIDLEIARDAKENTGALLVNKSKLEKLDIAIEKLLSEDLTKLYKELDTSKSVLNLNEFKVSKLSQRMETAKSSEWMKLAKERNELYKEQSEIRNNIKATEDVIKGVINTAVGNSGIKNELYRIIAGEVEARDVQARNSFTDEQRKGVTPGATTKIYKNNQVVLNRQNGSSSEIAEGSTVKAVRADLEAFIGNLGSRLKIVQSAKDLPIGLQKSISNRNPQGFVTEAGTGNAYLIADNIEPGKTRAVFMHEVGAHLGLEENLNDEQFDTLINKITEWSERNDGSIESKIAKAALERVSLAGVKDAHANSELLAYFIEEAINAGVNPRALDYKSELAKWFRALWTAFQNSIRKLGLNPANLTAQDLVDFAYGAAHLTMNDGNRPSKESMAPKEDIQFSLASGIKAIHTATENAKAATNKAPTWMQPTISAFTSAFYGAKKHGLGFAITEDVAHMAQKYMESSKDFVAAFKQKQALIRIGEQNIINITAKAQALTNAQRVNVNKLLADMTISGHWGYDPKLKDINGTPIAVTTSPKNIAAFDKLSKQEQEVIKDVFTSGREQLLREKSIHTNLVNELFASQVKAAGSDEKEIAKIEKEKSLALKKFDAIMKTDPNTPYAPLNRFGNYVVVAKSKEWLAAEKSKDTKWMSDHESDENHRTVQFAESMGEGKQIYQKLIDLGYDNVETPFERTKTQEGRDLIHAFAKLDNSLSKLLDVDEGASDSDKKIASKLKGMVNDLYLMSLANASARKSEMERKKVHGFNTDMLRGFFTQGMAKEHYLANIQTRAAMTKSMVDMQKEAKEGGDRTNANPLLNELLMHEEMSLAMRQPSIWDSVNRLTGDMFLTFSPGFYFQQATQSYVLSLPWMAGQHGYFKSVRALNNAYKDIFTLLKDKSLDLEKLPTDIREVIRHLVEEGKITIGQEAESRGFYSDQGSALDPRTSYLKVTNALRSGINNVETINRVTAAAAAYRLEMIKSGDKTKATNAAREVIHVTHGSYDGFNTPRYMGGHGFVRSVTQFKKFQVIQLSMLAREFQKMLGKDVTYDERKIAAKQFMFLFAHTAVLGGLKGVPIYALASLAYSLAKGIGGDDDDPEDFEAWLIKHCGTTLAHGVPNLVGVDLSKLSMQNVGSLLPYTDVSATKSGAEKAILGLAGPFIGGLLPKMVDGVGKMANGNIYKGMEEVLPSGVSNGLKALRFATDGVTATNGDQLLSADEMSFADIVGQAIGLPTTKITDRQYLQSELIKYEKFYKEKTSEVKQDYIEAKKDGDNAAISKAREEWSKLQDAKVKNGFTKTPLSELLKAPQAQIQRQKLVIGGVAGRKSNVGFLRQRSE